MTTHPFPRIEISCLERRAESIRLIQRQFHALHNALRASETSIKSAIAVDSGHSDIEVRLQYTLAIADLRKHYESLSLEKDNASRSLLNNPSASTSVGIVYVVPSRKDLFYSVIAVLTAALAAGNCVIVELPNTLSQVSGLLRKLLIDTLDADVFSISNDWPSDEFLSRCCVIDQTNAERNDGGSEATASADVVAIVDRTANVKEAASAVGMARLSFGGNAAYAPDIVLVDEFVAKDFLFHLTQAVTSPILGVSKGRQSPQNEQSARLERTKTVISGANGAIVEVLDCDSTLLQKVHGREIRFIRTTSLDDTIDISASLPRSLEACYIFAAPKEATYLANAIAARTCMINHVPVEILVGPLALENTTIPPRYSSASFRCPNPRHTRALDSIGRLTKDGNGDVGGSIESWSRAMLSNTLPPIKQKDGRDIGFFDQAFLVIGVTAISTISLSAFVFYRTTRRM